MKPFHFLKIYLARQYAKLFNSDAFIAVTGSVGKTACTQAIKAVLSEKFKTISTEANLDPVSNIPATILKMNPSVKRVILELGIEYQNEMVKPKTAVVTKISFAHSEFLGDFVESLPDTGLAILNWDDPASRKLAGSCKGKVVFFGTDLNNCLVWASNIRIENFNTVFELNLGVERVQVNYQLLGGHQIYPALAAATLGVIEKIPLTRIKIALESLLPCEHCLQPVSGPNGSIILDDTYDASPVACEAAIDTLMQIPARRRILVLGEMKELGKYSEKLHRQIAQKIYKEKVDLVLLGQGQTEFIAEELKSLGFWEEKVSSNLQNSQMVSKLLSVLEKGDVCLIKGSRSTRLDEVVKRIAKK